MTHEIDAKVQAAVAELIAVQSIITDDGLTAADQLLSHARATMKEIDLAHNDDIEFAHKEHKRLIAMRDEVKKPLDNESRRIKRLMADYKAEQERKRREEQRRIEAEARKAEEDRKLAEAIAAEQAGGKEEADQILAEPIMVPPAYVPPPPKTKARFQEVWKFEIDNPALVPRQFLKVDEVKIGQLVRSLKDEAKIPGVRVWKEKV